MVGSSLVYVVNNDNSVGMEIARHCNSSRQSTNAMAVDFDE